MPQSPGIDASRGAAGAPVRRSGLLSTGLLAAGLLAAPLPAPAALAQDGRADAPPPAATDLSDEAGLTYGTSGDDGAYSLLRQADGGMALGGSLGAGDDESPAWWMRFDRHGLPEQARLLPPGESGGIYGLVSLGNGDMAAVGDMEAEDGRIHAALHRLAPDGAIRWSAVLDSVPGTTYGIGVVEVPGGDLVFGVEGLDEAEEPFAMAIRATGEGRELWRRPIGELEDLAGLILQPDGTLLAAGNKAEGSKNEIRLVALAEDGATRLHATMQDQGLPENGTMSAYRAHPLPGGDIVLALDLTEAEDSPGGLLRLAPDGQVRWLRPIAGGPGLVENMHVIPSDKGGGTAIAVAGALVAADGEQDAFAGLLTADGEWRWARRFRGPRDTLFYAIAPLADGGLLAAGTALERLAPGIVVEEGADDTDQRDENAWLMTLTADGAPAAAAAIADPELAVLAEEMRLTARQMFAGSLATPGFGPLGPPAFRQDGDSLEMATTPFVAGPMLLNVTRTRFRPGDRPDLVVAATLLAQPVLQVADEDGLAVATVAGQRIDWRYTLGSFLAGAHEIALQGLELLSPDGTRMTAASLEGGSETRPQADGSLNIASRYTLQGLTGSRQAQGPDMPGEGEDPFALSAGPVVLQSMVTGLDGRAYAAAMRAAASGAPPQLQDHARGISGGFRAEGLQIEGDDDGIFRRIALHAVSIDLRMARPDLAAPYDLDLSYALQGLQVEEEGTLLGSLGSASLALSGSGWDLAALEAQAATVEDAEEDEMPAAIGRVLGAVGGAGLEFNGSDLSFDVEGEQGGFDALRLAVSVAGLRDDAARLQLKLDGSGLRSGEGGLPLSPALRPQDIVLDLRFGPLPAREMAMALLAEGADAMPVLLARSAPVLEIPQLAVIAGAGAVRGDGRFAVDPASPTMLAGQMTLLVTQLDNLRAEAMEMVADQGDRAMLAGFAAFLQELGQKAVDPDGKAAERFLVEAGPDGSITVNGQPFPPGDAGGSPPRQ